MAAAVEATLEVTAAEVAIVGPELVSPQRTAADAPESTIRAVALLPLRILQPQVEAEAEAEAVEVAAAAEVWLWQRLLPGPQH